MSTPAAVDAEGVVAPKLIRGRKSMAPPEMIKNYITGNVNVDAVVDATGHVRSVTVLSGPEKLRATAIEQMKQYLYQPAKKNGKPVPAHVQVSLQFWYEP
jgi:protein TonB